MADHNQTMGPIATITGPYHNSLSGISSIMSVLRALSRICRTIGVLGIIVNKYFSRNVISLAGVTLCIMTWGCTSAKINSIEKLREYSIGTWCFRTESNTLAYKLVINHQDHYAFYRKPLGQKGFWRLIQRGSVDYGRGKYVSDDSIYYFFHLDSLAINVGINNNTDIAQLNDSLPIWTVNANGNFEPHFATHDCNI